MSPMFSPLYTSSYGKEQIVNENFAIAEAFNRGVIDRTLSDPPAQPSSGGFYIPVATATGAWSGKENQLLWWSSVGDYWRTIIRNDGMKLNSQADGSFIRYHADSNTWLAIASGTTNRVFENVADVDTLNALSGMVAGDIAEILDSDGSGAKGWYVYDTDWVQISGTGGSQSSNGGTDSSNTDVLLFAKFDSADGNTLVDSSAYNRTLTLEGTAQLATIEGRAGVLFDGVDNGSVRIHKNGAEFLNYITEDFTIEFWINPTQYSSNNGSVNVVYSDLNWISGSNFDGIRIDIFNSGLRLVLLQQSPQLAAMSSLGTLPLNSWTHVALTLEGDTSTVYLNGSSSASQGFNRSSFQSKTFTTDAYIGNQIYTFNGQVGELFGYVDDLIITKAVKYTSNFTPTA